jgi:hypothetical protein
MVAKSVWFAIMMAVLVVCLLARGFESVQESSNFVLLYSRTRTVSAYGGDDTASVSASSSSSSSATFNNSDHCRRSNSSVAVQQPQQPSLSNTTSFTIARGLLSRACERVVVYTALPGAHISDTNEGPKMQAITLTDELFRKRRQDNVKTVDFARPLTEITARCTPELRASWSTFEQKESVLRDTTAFVIDYMHRHDAYYFAFFGTLLHMMRKGTPSGGKDDDDVDLGISLETMYWLMCSPLEQLIFDKFGFSVRSSANGNFGQIFHVCCAFKRPSKVPPIADQKNNVSTESQLDPGMLIVHKMEAGIDLYVFHHSTDIIAKHDSLVTLQSPIIINAHWIHELQTMWWEKKNIEVFVPARTSATVRCLYGPKAVWNIMPGEKTHYHKRPKQCGLPTSRLRNRHADSAVKRIDYSGLFDSLNANDGLIANDSLNANVGLIANDRSNVNDKSNASDSLSANAPTKRGSSEEHSGHTLVFHTSSRVPVLSFTSASVGDHHGNDTDDIRNDTANDQVTRALLDSVSRLCGTTSTYTCRIADNVIVNSTAVVTDSDFGFHGQRTQQHQPSSLNATLEDEPLTTPPPFVCVIAMQDPVDHLARCFRRHIRSSSSKPLCVSDLPANQIRKALLESDGAIACVRRQFRGLLSHTDATKSTTAIPVTTASLLDFPASFEDDFVQKLNACVVTVSSASTRMLNTVLAHHAPLLGVLCAQFGSSHCHRGAATAKLSSSHPLKRQCPTLSAVHVTALGELAVVAMRLYKLASVRFAELHRIAATLRADCDAQQWSPRAVVKWLPSPPRDDKLYMWTRLKSIWADGTTMRAPLTVTGIATHCDWIVGTMDKQKEPTTLSALTVRGDRLSPPRVVYVVTTYLHLFAQEVLPLLTHPFVLVTGSNDQTVPHCTDRRGIRLSVCKIIARLSACLLSHPLVLHWFAENGDTPAFKFSALPIGMRHSEEEMVLHTMTPVWHATASAEQTTDWQPVERRSLRVFVGNRIHAHNRGNSPRFKKENRAQMADRVDAKQLCQTAWVGFCNSTSRSMPLLQFVPYRNRFPFALLVHGGGIDLNPQLWELLAYGIIPIVSKHASLDMYMRMFPIVRLDLPLTRESLSVDQLVHWQRTFVPLLNNELVRNHTQHKMSMSFWRDVIFARASPVNRHDCDVVGYSSD